MHFDSGFSGRIFQVTEALSFEDAVSNQVLALDSMFSEMGFTSAVFAKYHDERHANRCKSIEHMTITERDVIVYHFYGFAEHTLPVVQSSYCTRVMLYHNITPHEFFPEGTRLRMFCERGREQLSEYISCFHFFWADSQFNLDELIEAGAPPLRCDVVPIIVSSSPTRTSHAGRAGRWLFVGRVSPNKCQIKLLDLFAEIRRERPDYARELHLIGDCDDKDLYVSSLRERVREHGLTDAVFLHGKLADNDRDSFFDSADVYVSLSEHEGFGVPLIEASLHDLPVIALGTSAVSETLGFGLGVASDTQSLKQLIIRAAGSVEFRAALKKEQTENAMRFVPAVVATDLARALRKFLPVSNQFHRVSLVICTYNRRTYLERIFDYLSHQSCGSFELIVIDGPSTDGTKAFLDGLEGSAKIGHNAERNLSKSRNQGIDLCDGDIIAFIDDDALPFDDWIENVLFEYNARPLTTAALGGPTYYAGTFWFQAEDNGINSRAEAKVGIPSNEIGKQGWLRYNTGTNATFSAAALREVGGFDEQFDYYLDESELCFRLQQQGKLVGYTDRVVVRHEFAQSDNRKGKLNYNWYTICKNTAYFICAYSGLSGAELQTYIQQRMLDERIKPLDGALAKNELSVDEYERHVQAVWSGVADGIKDALHFPRLRLLGTRPGKFKPYPISSQFPSFAAGRKYLHVAIISKEFPPFSPGGGIGTLYYHLASELLLMGNRVTVIVPGENAHLFRQGNMSVHFVVGKEVAIGSVDPGFARNISWSVSALTKLAEIHETDRIDIVDSALWDAEALSVAILEAGRRPPVVIRLVTPYMVAAKINGWSPPPETAALFVAAERALLLSADAVVPISESIASSIEEAFSLRRTIQWQTIPCGIAYWPFFDVNQGYADLPKLRGVDDAVFKSGRIILFVGRLERRKGIDIVLEASRRFLRIDEAVHLIVAGRDVEGWGERLAAMIPEDLRGRIHMVGEVTDAVRDKLLALAYCVLFPSRYESFGLVPLEAFVHGVPVVAAKNGAIPEVVENGVSGLLTQTDSPDELADAVCRMLTNPELRESLSLGALRRVRSLSSRSSALKSYSLYVSLIKARDSMPVPRQIIANAASG